MLTPKGFTEKTKLTINFMKAKMKEYDELKSELKKVKKNNELSRKLPKKGKSKIAVWGSGYIGLSTMAFFSKKNISCVGFDVNKEKVKTINSGKLPIKELKEWFGFDIKKAVKKKNF